MSEFFQLFLLPGLPVHYMPIILIAFLFSGMIKGFLGIGLPAAMAMLTIFIDPKTAISLMVLPIIFANVMQYFRSEALQNRLYIPLFCAGDHDQHFHNIFIYRVLPNFSSDRCNWCGDGVFDQSAVRCYFADIRPSGLASWRRGILWHFGRLSSIWSPPVAMYLLARNVSKEEFIGASGFRFLLAAFPCRRLDPVWRINF